MMTMMMMTMMIMMMMIGCGWMDGWMVGLNSA
jgi:hypothetical protein